jgi:phage terminase large subunit
LGFPGQWGYIASATHRSLQLRHTRKLQEEYRDLGRVLTRNNQQIFEFRDEALGGFYLINLEDPDMYRSAEFSFGFIDELTENRREIFDSMLYPIRSSQGLPYTPFGAGTNPDGVGHSWVKKLWITRDFDNEYYTPDRFVFVPALPTDNPTWEANQNVQETLKSLPPHLRRARLEGLWDAPEGARFPQLSEDIHLFNIGEEWPKGVPEGWTIILGLDYGLRAPFAALWGAVNPRNGDIWIYREVYRSGLTAVHQAEEILGRTGYNEKIRGIYADPSIWNNLPAHEGRPSKTLRDLYHEGFGEDSRIGPMVKGINQPRHHTLETIDRLLDHRTSPKLYIERGCVNLWRELTGAVWSQRGASPGKREDIDPRLPDHAIDALRYLCHTHTEAPERLQEAMPSIATIRQTMEHERITRSEKQFARRARKHNAAYPNGY